MWRYKIAIFEILLKNVPSEMAVNFNSSMVKIVILWGIHIIVC